MLIRTRKQFDSRSIYLFIFHVFSLHLYCCRKTIYHLITLLLFIFYYFMSTFYQLFLTLCSDNKSRGISNVPKSAQSHQHPTNKVLTCLYLELQLETSASIKMHLSDIFLEMKQGNSGPVVFFQNWHPVHIEILKKVTPCNYY